MPNAVAKSFLWGWIFWGSMYATSVSSPFGVPQIAQGSPWQDMPDSAAQFLRRNTTYSYCYGNQKAAQGFIFYLSLSCAHCRDLWANVIGPLRASPLFQGGHLWIRIRDFPSDSLGFWTSLVCRCFADKAQKQFETLMDQRDWITEASPLKKALDILKVSEVEANTRCFTSLKFKQDLMDFAKKEQNLLGLHQIPTIFRVQETHVQHLKVTEPDQVIQALQHWLQ